MDSSYKWSVYISSAILLAMILLFSYSFLTLTLELKVPFGRHILSAMCMCYNYILFIPLLAVNLAMIKVHFLAIINLPFIFLFSKLILSLFAHFSANYLQSDKKIINNCVIISFSDLLIGAHD